MVPSLIEEGFGREALPYWMQKNELGFIFYMTIFSVSKLAYDPYSTSYSSRSHSRESLAQ